MMRLPPEMLGSCYLNGLMHQHLSMLKNRGFTVHPSKNPCKTIPIKIIRDFIYQIQTSFYCHQSCSDGGRAVQRHPQRRMMIFHWKSEVQNNYSRRRMRNYGNLFA